MRNRIKIYYSALIVTSLLPYLPYLFRFIPVQFFGFTITGWAWIIMLLITLINIFQIRTFSFPIYFWLPWVLYMITYITRDYSFFGVQLTLQYILPIFIGIVTSRFVYSHTEINYIFKQFLRLCFGIYFLFVIGYFFRGGYGPSPASTVMFFSVVMSLVSALFFISKKLKYLIYIGLLLLVPIAQVTRMGIAALAAIFVFHFSNTNIKSKVIIAFTAIIVFFIVFNSGRFQKKTFKSGAGKVSDLTLNYYDNPKLKTSGRLSWKKALAPGLEKSPIWGNGPRADIKVLTKYSGSKTGEAHNDYLAVRYNYGYVGLGILLFGFLLNFVSLFRISRIYKRNDIIWLLSTSALTLFISFLMFMYTDNILKYTIFFPNYFFALIGMVYSLKKDEGISSNTSI